MIAIKLNYHAISNAKTKRDYTTATNPGDKGFRKQKLGIS